MNDYRFEEIELNQTEQFSVKITEAMMDAFRSMTGDVNPLHADAAFAGEQGHPDKVCFGMLTAAFLSTLAGVYLPGKYALIQSVEVKFSRPVYPGEVLTITGKVAEKNETFRFLVVKAEIRNAEGVKKCKATMQIGVLK